MSNPCSLLPRQPFCEHGSSFLAERHVFASTGRNIYVMVSAARIRPPALQAGAVTCTVVPAAHRGGSIDLQPPYGTFKFKNRLYKLNLLLGDVISGL